MDKIRFDIVKQTLIVGNDKESAVFAAQSVNAFGNDLQRVDVKTGVDLVQNDDLRFQHHHLQNFIAFLLAAGEAFIQVTVHELRVHLQFLHLAFHQTDELDQRYFTAFFTAGVDCAAQEVGIRYAGNFARVLHGQEQSRAGALVNGHFQQVFAFKGYGSFRYFVFRVTHERGGQRTFTCTVRPHDGVNLAALHLEIQSFQNLFPFNRRFQTLNDKFCRHTFSLH
ncbi:hypothetical protein D3C71_1504780 [compost metagenome]